MISGIIALSVILVSIILGAIGDGLNDRGKKVIGHALRGGGYAVLVASPWLLNIDPDFPIQYGIGYGLSYWFIRMGTFDLIRNISKGDKQSCNLYKM